MAHTKGKWEFKSVSNLIVSMEEEKIIARIIKSEFTGNAEEIANAQLIASAPDLLEACKQAIKVNHDPDYLYKTLRDAIAKAEA